MPQPKTAALVDDLTGRKAAETVAFALDGTAYEINLNKRNAAAFRKLVAQYINAGRPAGTVVEIDPSTLAAKPPARRATTSGRKRGGKRSTTASATEAAAKAAPATSRRARSSGRGKAVAEPTSAEIRAWAGEQGIELSGRGRISNAIRDQYRAAHAG